MDDDLLKALSSGSIKQATLDVFNEEPLPREHPFWVHPAITVTPHISSRIDAEMGGRLIAQNLRIFEETGTGPHVTDPSRGY